MNKHRDEHKAYVKCACANLLILTNEEDGWTTCKCNLKFAATTHGMSQPYGQGAPWPKGIIGRHKVSQRISLSGFRFNLSKKALSLMNDIKNYSKGGSLCTVLHANCSDGRTRVDYIHVEYQTSRVCLDMYIQLQDPANQSNSVVVKRLNDFIADMKRVDNKQVPDNYYESQKIPVEWVQKYTYA